jgi:hypothetical protein
MRADEGVERVVGGRLIVEVGEFEVVQALLLRWPSGGADA